VIQVKPEKEANKIDCHTNHELSGLQRVSHFAH